LASLTACVSRGARRRAEADLFGDPRSERIGDVLHPLDSDAGIVGGLPALDLLLGQAEAVRQLLLCDVPSNAGFY